MNEVLQNATTAYGGGVFKTSAGTLVAVFWNGTGIVAYADPDGTPSILGAAQVNGDIFASYWSYGVSTLPNPGRFACVMDSNDDIHFVAIAGNVGDLQTRHVAYGKLSGIESTPSWATWTTVLGEYAEAGGITNRWCAIDVDSNDYPRVAWVEIYKYKGTDYPQIYYSHNVGSGWITKEKVVTSDTGRATNHIGLVVDTDDDDVEVFWYSSADYIPRYRRRNGSWGTEGAWSSYTGATTNNPVVCLNGTIHRYATRSADYHLYEDEADTGLDHVFAGSFGKLYVAQVADTLWWVHQGDSNYLYVDYDDGGGWTEDTSPLEITDYSNIHVSSGANCGFADGTCGILLTRYISFQYDVYYHEIGGGGPGTDNLAASSLAGGTPVLGSPTIGQKHVLSASDLTTTPVLGTPTLGVIGSDDLTALSLVGGTPVLGQPTLGQKHVLAASALETTPVLGKPTLGQVHALSAQGLTVAPVLGLPTLAEAGGEVDELDARDLTGGRPVLGQPTLGVKHNLAASALTTTPTLGKPTLGVIRHLEASDLTTTPVLGKPTLSSGGTDNLTANDLDLQAAVLGTPTIGQKHALGAQDLTTTPVLGTPTLSTQGIDDLTANSLEGGTPDLEKPTLGQVHNLTPTALAITPVLGKPTLGQVHALEANDLTVTPVLGTPSAGAYDDLTANDLVGGTPVLGTPTLGLVGDALLSSDLTTTPVLGRPTLTQVHALEAVGITIPAYSLGVPALLYIPPGYVTPRERWHCPHAENRTMIVAREIRELEVPHEDREFSPKPPVK